MARSILAALFIVIGGVLSVPASLAIWGDRTVADEDEFVSTLNEVLEDEDVQIAIASRLTPIVMEQLDIETRIGTGLGGIDERLDNPRLQGIELLQGPLTRATERVVFEACMRILNSPAFEKTVDTVLRTSHRAVMALIENDKDVLDTTNGQVVLDLRPLIAAAVEELVGERGLELIENANIPEDAGQIVIIQEQQYPNLWKLARYINDINPWVPITTIIFFLLGIAVARDRARALIGVGGTLVIVAALVLLALAVPVEELATSWPPRPEGVAAAQATYEILVDSFRSQQLFLVLLGLGLAGTGALFKNPEVIRFVYHGKDGATPGFTQWVRKRETILRALGLGVAAVLLLLWPDPSSRVVITIVTLAVVYLVGLAIVTSQAAWAETARTRVGSSLRPADGAKSGIAVAAPWLRIAAVGLTAAFLIFWPTFSYTTFLLVVAVLLLFLAALDFYVNSDKDEELGGPA